MKKSLVSCAIGGLLAGSLTLTQAQLPVSRTSFAELVQLTPGLQYVSLAAKATPVARGTVTAVTSDTVTLDVPAGTFSSLSGAHSAQIVSGPWAGYTFDVTNPTGTQIDMDGLTASAASVAVNLTEVEVVKQLTLDEAFPSGGNFTSGATPGSADRLVLVNGGAIFQAFYNGSSWVDTLGNPAGSTTLPLNGGAIVNGAATPGSAFVSGVAPSGDQVVSYDASGLVAVGNPYGEALTLADLESVVNPGATPGAADRIIFVSGGALLQVFFDGTDWNSTAGGTVADTTALGDGFFVQGAAAGVITFEESF